MRSSSKKSRFARAAALGLTAALVAGASLFGATAAQAAPGDTYSVTGTVVDGTAAPLAGVEVTTYFTPAGESQNVRTDVTAVGGTFTLTGIPDGAHTINFNLDGYGYTSVDVTVAGADVTAPTATMLPLTDAAGASATIAGTGLVGDTLTVTTTGWPVGTVFSYQWVAPGPYSQSSEDISGANASTYVVTSSEVGRYLSVFVSGRVPGVSAPSDPIHSNAITGSAPKKPTGPAPAGTTGSTPAAQTSAGLPAGPLDPAVDHAANVNWTAADSYVDVYIFSTPTLVGTFPVVNGVAQITLSKAVLAKLAAGTHTLVITGQTSGAVQSVTVALSAVLASTGASNPAPAITMASLLLLLGAGLLIARRRVGHKI